MDFDKIKEVVIDVLKDVDYSAVYLFEDDFVLRVGLLTDYDVRGMILDYVNFTINSKLDVKIELVNLNYKSDDIDYLLLDKIVNGKLINSNKDVIKYLTDKSIIDKISICKDFHEDKCSKEDKITYYTELIKNIIKDLEYGLSLYNKFYNPKDRRVIVNSMRMDLVQIHKKIKDVFRVLLDGESDKSNSIIKDLNVLTYRGVLNKCNVNVLIGLEGVVFKSWDRSIKSDKRFIDLCESLCEQNEIINPSNSFQKTRVDEMIKTDRYNETLKFFSETFNKVSLGDLKLGEINLKKADVAYYVSLLEELSYGLRYGKCKIIRDSEDVTKEYSDMVERFECDFSLAKEGVRSLDSLNPENPMLDIDINVLDELVERLNSGEIEIWTSIEGF